VASVEVDVKKDLCNVGYDPERVTVEQMREAIRQQGFEGEVRDPANGS